MGKVYEQVDGRLKEFVERQHVFFVATAPLAGDGLVNVSPRGVPGTFGMLDEHTFAWLDGSGSGSETIAHLRENGRITVMFCAFDGPPNIVRFHGRGRVVTRYDEAYADLAGRFEALPGDRAVIVVDIDRISDSCGYAVPLMSYEGERDLLPRYFERKGVEGSADYRRRKNRTSLDGLPAYDYDPLDEWSTPEGLAAIRERMGAQIDGWKPPVGFGIAVDGELTRANGPGGRHGLAAVVLATVLRHDGSTATLPMTPEQLGEAIATLAPAEACKQMEHPNLGTWCELRDRLNEHGGSLAAVFVRDVADPVSSPEDKALREAW